MANATINLKKYIKALDMTYYKKMGKVMNVVGLTIESAGPDAKIGDLCRIYKEGRSGESLAEGRYQRFRKM